MVASGLLRERDLRVLTAVIGDGLRDEPGPGMPWAILDRLLQLVPCDGVQFEELDLQKHSVLAGQVVDDGGNRITGFGSDLDSAARFPVLRRKFLSNSYLTSTGNLVSVLRWSDFYTVAELKNAPWRAARPGPRTTPC
jgi:hypothetical protein